MAKFILMMDVVLSMLAVMAAILFPSWSFWLLLLAGFLICGVFKDIYNLGKENNHGNIVAEDDLPKDIYQVVSMVEDSECSFVILRNEEKVVACKSKEKYFSSFRVCGEFFVPTDLVSLGARNPVKQTAS